MTHIGKLHILENLRGCLNFSFYCEEGEGAVAIPFSEYVCFRWQVTEEGKNYVGIFLLNCMQSRNVRRQLAFRCIACRQNNRIFFPLSPHEPLVRPKNSAVFRTASNTFKCACISSGTVNGLSHKFGAIGRSITHRSSMAKVLFSCDIKNKKHLHA